MGNDFRMGPWIVRPGLNTVFKNGAGTRLEPKVMEVLACLASQAGAPVSKETILKTVWPDTFVSDDVLVRSISELRRVFEDDAREPRFIETIPKRGYRLVVPVEQVNGTVGAAVQSPAQTQAGRDETQRDPVRTSRVIVAVCSAGLFLVVALLLLLNTGGLRDRLSGNKARAIRSLAVLPFESLSDDPKQAYFAEGVTDALTTDLAQINALRVVSRTTMMRYGRPDKPLPEIARELSVDGIVEGTVQRSGDRVRITAQLIYGPSDQHLWASSYSKDIKDVLELQNTVAAEIAQQISVNLTPEEQVKLRNVRPVNPRALDAYVEARFHIDQAVKLAYYKDKEPIRKSELRTAISYLDHATREDPAYVPAYIAYFEAVDATDISDLDFLSRAKAALQKAQQLEEGNVAAHLAMARLLMQYEYDWAGAEREYKRAIEFNPNSATAHFDYSEYLQNVGRNGEGEKERDLAQALDPATDYFSDAAFQRIGRSLEQQRQMLEEQTPDDPFAVGVMGKNYAIAGRFKESVEMWERCLTLYGWRDFAEVMERADAKAGPRFALEEWMRTGEDYEMTHGDMPVVPMAFTDASLGNKDRAFVWLGKAVEQRNWMIIYLKRDPVWDPLRSDPRFGALLHRVGLPQ